MADWSEEDHPREEHGRFASAGGEAHVRAAAKRARAPQDHASAQKAHLAAAGAHERAAAKSTDIATRSGHLAQAGAHRAKAAGHGLAAWAKSKVMLPPAPGHPTPMPKLKAAKLPSEHVAAQHLARPREDKPGTTKRPGGEHGGEHEGLGKWVSEKLEKATEGVKEGGEKFREVQEKVIEGTPGQAVEALGGVAANVALNRVTSKARMASTALHGVGKLAGEKEEE